MPPRTLTDFDKRILEFVIQKPGYKAATIALLLDARPDQVSASLKGPLLSRVRREWESGSYRWYPRSNAAQPQPAVQERAQALDSELSQLCRYYLDCLSQDDMGGVSVFAVAHPGTSDYTELPHCPLTEEFNPFEVTDAARLLTKVQASPNQLTLFVGYPVRAKFVQTQKWSGYLLEPLLLFPFQEAEGGRNPILSQDPPLLNVKALGSLSNAQGASIVEEAYGLSEELGLESQSTEPPDLCELLDRLKEVRPAWDWQEAIVPEELSKGLPLCEVHKEGIFNRCVLVVAERSKYTRGLEAELKALQTKDTGNYSCTAIGHWLGLKEPQPVVEQSSPLLEVLPLNSEQQLAVRQALTNQLTVVTGPPGTGKSQVVASILINAAFQGQTVLFASKNNKAVDVVESRVNALGARPILLRLGSNKYQSALAQYLTNLLSAKSSQEDESDFERSKAFHQDVKVRSSSLDTELEALINLRNEVDSLDQEVALLRREVGDESFAQIRSINYEELKSRAHSVKSAIRAGYRAGQNVAIRLIWPIVRGSRQKRLKGNHERFAEFDQLLRMVAPSSTDDIGEAWLRYLDSLDARLAQIERAMLYFKKLDELTLGTPIEALSQQRKKLSDELAQFSAQLWDCWLRLQPSRISQDQRRLIGNYTALIEMIASASARGANLKPGVFAQYYRLFPQIASILSCWAVTALAARGKLPFDAGFFDLLIVDEASQCDIASALPLLYRAKRAVIIGDSMQLPHISGLSKSQDQRLLEKHELLGTRAGWSYSSKSLFDLAASQCRPDDILMIRDHFRSHSDIIQFSNEAFYEGKLRLATPYNQLRRPWSNGPAVRWIDVEGEVTRPRDGGALNDAEAQAIVGEIERLVQQGYQGTIGVVSPFRAQANRIRDLISQRSELAGALARANFLVDVVHSFQGDERDVILFSPVISRDTPRGALWFVDSSSHKERLFNVSITRARAALVVVGDRAALSQCESSHLKKFVSHVENLTRIRNNKPVQVVRDLGELYPAVANPEQVSEYERQFYTALYRKLKSRCIWPIPQYSVDKYCLDFALIVNGRMLNIEIDGERYHRAWNGELCRRDQIRNIRLMELGWDVMRFWVYQVRDDIDRCLDRVEAWCVAQESGRSEVPA